MTRQFIITHSTFDIQNSTFNILLRQYHSLEPLLCQRAIELHYVSRH